VEELEKKDVEDLLEEIRRAWTEKGYPTLAETLSDQSIIVKALERYRDWVRGNW